MFKVMYKTEGETDFHDWAEVDTLKEALSHSDGFEDGTVVQIWKLVKKGTTVATVEWDSD